MSDPSATRRSTAPLQAVVRAELGQLLDGGRHLDALALVATAIIRTTVDVLDAPFDPSVDLAHARLLALANVNGAVARGIADAIAMHTNPERNTP